MIRTARARRPITQEQSIKEKSRLAEVTSVTNSSPGMFLQLSFAIRFRFNGRQRVLSIFMLFQKQGIIYYRVTGNNYLYSVYLEIQLF